MTPTEKRKIIQAEITRRARKAGKAAWAGVPPKTRSEKMREVARKRWHPEAA